MREQTINTYTFGPLTVRVQGLGVYLGGKHLQAACDALSAEQLKQANREAWRQRKSAVRIANRQSNVSVYGWNDRRDQLIDVAEVVCKETWRRMQRAV
jgi:hypothetical protein